MNPTTPQDPQSAALVHKSPGFSALLNLMQDPRKYSLLDLGQALGVNVNFWSQFQCSLRIEDFYRTYRARVASDPEAARKTIMAELLEFDEGECFDVILVWDLLNYLEPEELEELIAQLARWCRPGTLLFAIISTLPRIPAEPVVFRIVDSEQMIYDPRTQETLPSPRYQPRDIARYMARFDVSSSFLMRHGVQEYLFVYRGNADQ